MLRLIPLQDAALFKKPLAGGLLEIAKDWDFILDSPRLLSDWNLLLALPQGNPLIITAEYARSSGDDVVQTVLRARGPHWKTEGIVL